MTPAGTSNKPDVQNKWEENTHTHTHDVTDWKPCSILLGMVEARSVTCCCCCCFSHSAHWLPTRKKLLYTVANPARGLLNREKKKKKKKCHKRYEQGQRVTSCDNSLLKPTGMIQMATIFARSNHPRTSETYRKLIGV